MGTDRQPYLTAPGEGEALWSLGCLTIIKAAGDQAAGTFALIDETAPKSEGIPFHRHEGDDENFYILEGEVVFHIEDSGPFSAVPGAFVHIPKGSVHSFRVESPVAHYLILTTPRHAQFYRAIAEPAKSHEMPTEVEWDMDKIVAACEQFDVKIVDSPPGTKTD